MKLGEAINHLNDLVKSQNESIYDVALDTIRQALPQPKEDLKEIKRKIKNKVFKDIITDPILRNRIYS